MRVNNQTVVLSCLFLHAATALSCLQPFHRRAPPPPPPLQPAARRAVAAHCTAASSSSSSSPEEQFRQWMEEQRPGQTTSVHFVVSAARTPFGALRDIWKTVLRSAQTGAPPVTVLLLPDVAWLQEWERMAALDKHLRACRDCTAYLGSRIRMQALHPQTRKETQEDSEVEMEQRRAPLPSFTLTSRVGPSVLRPPGAEQEAGEEDEEGGGTAFSIFGGDATGAPSLADDDATAAPLDEELERQRQQLERQFRVAVEDTSGSRAAGAAPEALDTRSSSNDAAAGGGEGGRVGRGGVVVGPTTAPRADPKDPKEVLDATMEWFSVYFDRVYRLFGSRQRRLVVEANSAEAVFLAFWSEAARLYGDEEEEDDEPGAATAAAAGGGRAGATATDDQAARDEDVAVVLQEPEVPLSSLLVLAGGVEDVETYRAIRQALALSLALLGLAAWFELSAFHPRDTFEIRKAEDGTRTWEVTLPYPIMHLVKKMKTASSS